MGKSITPKYAATYSYICFSEKRRKIGRFAWNCKEYGRPTIENAKRWRQGFNASLERGGANEHLNQSAAGTITIYEQRGRREVCKYTPPMFEVI